MSHRAPGLSSQAQALLERRLARRAATPARSVIPRLAAGEPAPMSFAQWRLWFLEQLRPGTNAWNTPVVARLRGRLDVGALRQALELVVMRHKTLRTVFPAAKGQPVPVLIDAPQVDLPVIDAVDEDGLARGVEAEVKRSFDLAGDLMVRARLFAVGGDEHVLVLVAHHIACDGWSKGLLLAELGQAYDALVQGADPRLPELAIDYVDYAAWQRASLTGENLDGLGRYWSAALRDHPAYAELPTDLPRPRTQQFRGATVPVVVDAADARAAVELGRRRKATPFMTMMAAFMTLLHAHSGQEDLLVGSPSAMRTLPELEPIVGLFANTLIYRTSLAGRPTFAELVDRVKATALGVYQHQDMPFEKIVEVVKPPRDASRNPLVQVNLRVEGREPELRLHGIDTEPIDLDPGIARFDLAIELGVTDDGYAGYLEYDTHLFAAATVQRMADQFLAVLSDAVAAPDTAIADLAAVASIRAAGEGRP